ncbi:MAG TPA: PQQ-binding-like beta-propeller repeat protein [Bryobacteraceae bacterium]|nr:PQQ-binding-like beta-propeller repeat protein [Bryobacteraceae bacterium]
MINQLNLCGLRRAAAWGLCLASAVLLAPLAHAAPQAALNASATVAGGDVSSSAASPAFSAQELAALPVGNWVKNGGALNNQNYSPLKQINRENVGTLKAVWQTHLDGSGLATKYSGEGQPVVYQGVVYIVTGADDVFAISVKTGEILWRYKANLDQSITGVCCGWDARGLAMGDGKIYVGQLDGRLVALDQKTGQPGWSIQAERWQEGFSITAAPLYYDGMVVVAFAGGENGIRGRVKAFDAKDGHLLWTFYTIPGPGELGHDTWPKDTDAWKYGGATVWQTPAVDPDLGLLYFTTGNPGPDFNGKIRRGDNLFANSMLAIEAKTGKYRWHFQQVHHDLWDYDGPNPVMLFDVKVGGRVRKAAAEANKDGWVYILDRTNGKPLLGIDEKPVPQEPLQFTSATQPFPRGDAFVPQSIDIAPEGYALVNGGRIFTPFWSEGVVAKPATRGGANWAPSSYDPATNTYYVCATDAAQLFKGGEEDEKFPQPGQRYLGGAFGGMPLGPAGIFAALDMKTNRLVWQQRWKDSCYSGSVSTAAGLVFVGRNDGRLMALNSSNGQRLWEFQTGAGVNAPAAVFEYEGEQFVVAYSGGSMFAPAPRGDSLFLFSLKGTLTSGSVSSPQPPAAERR